MKCPFCNAETLHGYFNCGRAIWSEKRRRFNFRPNKGEKYALRLGAPATSLHSLESDFYPKCKRLIIDATGYESNLP